MEAVEDFLAIGRDVNAPDEKGRTPLHYCVAYWSRSIADLLLEAGANLEAQVGNLPGIVHVVKATFVMRIWLVRTCPWG